MPDREVPAFPHPANPVPHPEPSVPTGDVVGRPADEVAELYRAEGFRVEVIDYDVNPNPVLTADISFNRIRLNVRGGRVTRAAQG